MRRAGAGDGIVDASRRRLRMGVAGADAEADGAGSAGRHTTGTGAACGAAGGRLIGIGGSMDGTARAAGSGSGSGCLRRIGMGGQRAGARREGTVEASGPSHPLFAAGGRGRCRVAGETENRGMGVRTGGGATRRRDGCVGVWCRLEGGAGQTGCVRARTAIISRTGGGMMGRYVQAVGGVVEDGGSRGSSGSREPGAGSWELGGGGMLVGDGWR